MDNDSGLTAVVPEPRLQLTSVVKQFPHRFYHVQAKVIDDLHIGRALAAGKVKVHGSETTQRLKYSGSLPSPFVCRSLYVYPNRLTGVS